MSELPRFILRNCTLWADRTSKLGQIGVRVTVITAFVHSASVFADYFLLSHDGYAHTCALSAFRPLFIRGRRIYQVLQVSV